MTDLLILSDLHLGSWMTNHEALLKLDVKADTIVLAGDVLDSPKASPPANLDSKVLSHLRSLADAGVWLSGNHDDWAIDVAHDYGFFWSDELLAASGDKLIHVQHGHRFDTFIDSHPKLTWLGDLIYRAVGFLNKRLAGKLKHISKLYNQTLLQIEYGAVEEAVERQINIVVCGHTHTPGVVSHFTHTSHPITYLNCGCWTEHGGTYVTITDGTPELHHLS